MAGPCIPIPNPVTSEWLTAILRQSGVLHQGEVETVEREVTGAFNSRTSRLLLRFTTDAASDIPTHLILKQNNQEAWGIEAGAEEVKFYNLVASLRDHPPVTVPCYAAAHDERSGDSYLLLQDVSETHQQPVTRDQQINIVEGVPADVYVEAVVETLAQLHAYWWEHALLEADIFAVGYWSRNADRFEQYLRRRKVAWEDLIANERTWFPGDLRVLYERTFAGLRHHWQRYLEPRFRTRTNLTLIHGDAYFANFLCPKNPSSGATYLLDWQSPSFDVGGYDLANLIAAFWTPQQRHEGQREEKMLRRYHAVLQQHGVSNYSWDDLLTDYKTGLIFWLLMPVQDRYGGSGKDYWWPKMQCLAAAYQEWHCEELLGT
jgi:thiamine kinase-like enzyme